MNHPSLHSPRIAAALGWLLATPVLALASNLIPAARPTKPLLLTGGEVHTVSGAVQPNTDVLVVGGRIAQVGRAIKPPAGAEVVNVAGRRVYPGLIAAYTELGLYEITGLKQTTDSTEVGTINPNARAQTAINPDSELIPVARANGVLTALAVPGSRGSSLIAGTSTLLRLDGWTWEDLTLRSPVALHLHWPSLRPSRGTGSPAPARSGPGSGSATGGVRVMEDAFTSAAAYARAKAAGGGALEIDLRWEAMLPALRGEQPVFIHANEVKQIRAALAFAKKHGLKLTIVGGLDAWRVADELKAVDVPVIVGATETLPLRRDDDFEAAYANPARLHAAGVRFCIANSPVAATASPGNERNLPYHAARAAAHGLPPEIALRAVTLSAAELLGVGAELGSIDVGKRATLIVTDGDPLEIPTQVQMAFIDGARIDLRSRHTQLYEKYGERLKRLREARPAVTPGTQ